MLDDIGRKHLEDHVQKLDDEKSRQLLAQIKAEEGGEFHFPDYLLSGDPELDREGKQGKENHHLPNSEKQTT